jgi:hypothetical protein
MRRGGRKLASQATHDRYFCEMKPRPRSPREHLLKHRQDLLQHRGSHAAKTANHALPIHRPYLIEYYITGLSSKTAGNAQGIPMPFGSQRRDNESAQMLVEFVGRDNNARARLSNFASTGRIKVYENHFAASYLSLHYHFHFSTSKRVLVGASINRSHRARGPAWRPRSNRLAGALQMR